MVEIIGTLVETTLHMSERHLLQVLSGKTDLLDSHYKLSYTLRCINSILSKVRCIPHQVLYIEFSIWNWHLYMFVMAWSSVHGENSQPVCNYRGSWFTTTDRQQMIANIDRLAEFRSLNCQQVLDTAWHTVWALATSVAKSDLKILRCSCYGFRIWHQFYSHI